MFSKSDMFMSLEERGGRGSLQVGPSWQESPPPPHPPPPWFRGCASSVAAVAVPQLVCFHVFPDLLFGSSLLSKHSLCFETQPLFRNMDVTATTASQNDIQSHLGSSAISEGCDVTCASKRISAHSILASPGPTGHVLMMWVLIM